MHSKWTLVFACLVVCVIIQHVSSEDTGHILRRRSLGRAAMQNLNAACDLDQNGRLSMKEQDCVRHYLTFFRMGK